MSSALDKIKIARSFSRAANNYDSAAYFQRDMGLELMSMLPAARDVSAGLCCLDLGCGTGFFHRHLTSLYECVDYFGVDMAEGMLQFFKRSIDKEKSANLLNVSSNNSSNNSSSIRNKNRTNDFLLCADAENLSIKNEAVDIVFSNMAVQWSEDLPALFAELKRILKPDGIIAFTTLGPKTLIELKQSWQRVDEHVHVNSFFPLERWLETIQESGFIIETQRVLMPQLKFDSVNQLLKELKLIGAHNVNKGRPPGLLGKKCLAKLYLAYEEFKINDYFPASYEVYFFVIKNINSVNTPT
jgi:malonyl-CoA O-methyltransferase